MPLQVLQDQFHIVVFKDGEAFTHTPGQSTYPTPEEIARAIEDHGGNAAQVHKVYVLKP